MSKILEYIFAIDLVMAEYQITNPILISEKIQEDRKEKIEILQKSVSKSTASLHGSCCNTKSKENCDNKIACSEECKKKCEAEGKDCKALNNKCCN